MEQALSSSAHPSFLQLPGTLIEILLGRSIQTWWTDLHKSVSRLWSSLQYRAELGHPSTSSWAGERTRLSASPIRKGSILADPEDDGGSSLSREDAEVVMERMGLSCTRGEQEGGGIGHGEISRLFEEKEPSLEEVREAFDVFDVNGDGFIEAEELQRVLRGLGMEEGKEVEDCGRMIRAFDENGDGRIDFREFVKLMENCFC